MSRKLNYSFNISNEYFFVDVPANRHDERGEKKISLFNLCTQT
jgi:hypothetical protein